MRKPDRNYRRRLPHLRERGMTYFVTWRLRADQADLTPHERGIVANAIRHFDAVRYDLTAYVVMNDHVHVVFSPAGDHQVSDILHSWKSFTAHALRRPGGLWQDESFDRIVRDEAELNEKVLYILNNPRQRWPDLSEYAWAWSLWGGP